MYISEIRIDGFTSYLSETSVSDLSPGVNVVVGRNGAGKSNFFAAIRFVLADLADRSTNDLLYNGRGRRAAYSRVEVVLADANSRFLSLGESVVIGREIVNGGDRYLINGKQSTKSEARALLDSAGLSYGGNAFFVVPQGDVTRLASASDEVRLDTLLAASGAQTFEDRKKAALKILEDSDNQLNECNELLGSMERHLEQVGRDAENLKEHLELRKQLRGIEYVLINVEKLRTTTVIAAEEKKFEEQRIMLDKVSQLFHERERQADLDRVETANIEAKLAEAEAELELSERELSTRRHEAKAAANLAAAVSTSAEFYGGEESLTMNFGRNLSSAGSTMEVDSAHDDDSATNDANEPVDPSVIDDLMAQISELRERLNLQNRELSASSSRLRALQLKEGRGHQLSAEDRDAARKTAIQGVEDAIAAIHHSLEQEKQRESELSSSLRKAELELSELETKAQDAAEEVAALTSEQQIARQQLSEAESARTMALLGSRKAEITRERLEKAAEQTTKQLLSSSKSSAVRSIRGIRELAKQLKLSPSQYLGTIADLIEVERTVSYAVDRVAGPQMFYHVADNLETVQKLVEAMEQAPPGSIGSATFVPLADVIVDPPTQFEALEGTTPLASLVGVKDARFEKLVRLLFGKHVLCQDLRTAMQYSRKYQLPAVTSEGDLCDPRGAISGGSGPATSATSSSGQGYRQGLIRELSDLHQQIMRQQDEAEKHRDYPETAAQRVTQCVDALNRSKVQLLRASLARQDASIPVLDMHEQVTTLSRQLGDTRAAIAKLEADLSASEQDRRSVESIDGFAGALNQTERSELEALTSTVTSLRLECDKLGDEEYGLMSKFQRLQSRYEQQRAAEFHREADNIAAEDSNLSTAAAEAEHRFLAANAETMERRRRLTEVQQEAALAHDRVTASEDAFRSAEQEFKALSRKMENQSVKMRALSGLVADLETKLHQLGSIPESALLQAQEYTSENANFDERELKAAVRELTARQKEVSQSLSDLGDVNQRAINDHETYSTELSTLREQHAALSSERETIISTINALDLQKREKLDAMLDKVVSKFQSVFAALSGNECGTLILNRDPDTGELKSVGLDVSFGAIPAQMSGGQKSLCALALIFAIQACDPAAFYVFDEIDANLDEAARNRVANTIKSISQKANAQFICTTFREELVLAGDAWFGVTYHGRESRIEQISREAATEFICVEDVPAH